MAKVVVMDHPLIQHKIGYIRRKQTGTKDFRQTISEIAMLIPEKGVSRNVSTIPSARFVPTMPAPMANMFASLCSRVIEISKRST